MYINETWFSGLLGGFIIGFAALVLMAGIGKIAGISGILAKATELSDSISWQVCFIAGMLLTALIYHWFISPIAMVQTTGIWQLVIAGLFVGIGTRVGNGCTSGHGVCGIGRMSLRSLMATMTFMLSAIITVALIGV